LQNFGIMKFLKFIILPLNYIVALILLISASVQYISPLTFGYVSFLGTFFPIFLTINIIFLLWWALCLNKHFLISAIALILVFPNYKRIFSFSENKEEICEQCKSVRIFSYNTMTMDCYKKASKNKTLKYLKDIDTDIMCLQEIGWKSSGDYLKKNDILNALEPKFAHHYFHIASETSWGNYGIAVFTKYKIINPQEIVFKSSFNSALKLDLSIEGDTVRLINCHLESNGLTMHERKSLTNDATNKRVLFGTLKKMRRTSIIRAKQADEIAKMVAESPYPVIVCGDFNDTAYSYTYKTISQNLNDAFIGSGIGTGFTFFDHFFRFRIDYILTSNRFATKNFKVEKADCSDHRPISCEIIFKQ